MSPVLLISREQKMLMQFVDDALVYFDNALPDPRMSFSSLPLSGSAFHFSNIPSSTSV